MHLHQKAFIEQHQIRTDALTAGKSREITTRVLRQFATQNVVAASEIRFAHIRNRMTERICSNGDHTGNSFKRHSISEVTTEKLRYKLYSIRCCMCVKRSELMSIIYIRSAPTLSTFKKHAQDTSVLTFLLH